MMDQDPCDEADILSAWLTLGAVLALPAVVGLVAGFLAAWAVM